jgi:hypothetical protein
MQLSGQFGDLRLSRVELQMQVELQMRIEPVTKLPKFGPI